MIDPSREELILPREAARLYPRGPNGKVVHVSRVYRDMLHGHDGIRLESVHTPRLATSRQAVTRFFARLTEKRRPAPQGGGATRDNDGRVNRSVEQELDRLGI